jgi:hypothetical protein
MKNAFFRIDGVLKREKFGHHCKIVSNCIIIACTRGMDPLIFASLGPM